MIQEAFHPIFFFALSAGTTNTFVVYKIKKKKTMNGLLNYQISLVINLAKFIYN